MSRFELAEEQYNEVVRLARAYYLEAHKCKSGKAYLAGCIMIGGALEASLLAFANCYPNEALSSTVAPTKRGSIKPLAEWSLAELLAVAKEQSWLSSGLSLSEQWDNEKAHIGDYAEALRQIRNFIHPVRYLLDFPHKRITKRYLEALFEIFEVANDYLMNKIGESLRIAFERGNKESEHH